MTKDKDTKEDPELKELREQLEAIQAERTIEEVSAEPTAKQKLQRDIADETAIRDCGRKFGVIGKGTHAVYTEQGVVIVRRPTLAEWRMYQAVGDADAEQKLEAQDALVQACVVHPDLRTFRQIEEGLPYITAQLAGAASILAGYRLAHTAKKS